MVQPKDGITTREDPPSRRKYEERPDHFKTTFGLVVSCLGCVVGTGNIWRFPRILANASDEVGGLVFLIVWILFLMLWSIPMLLLEYGAGRYTGKAVIGSFRYFVGDKGMWCGAFISVVTLFISSYYSVIVGWCMYYLVYFCANDLPDNVEDSTRMFKDFAEHSYWPVATHAVAVLIAGVSVVKGVKSIEKVNMVLVPLLLVIILFNLAWSLTRPLADYGIIYMFTPNWDSFANPRLWVDAVSQNAFDTGAGMGLMIPYSSYMTAENSIVKYGTLIPLANNVISLICGITIYATVFSTLTKKVVGITRPQIISVLKDSGPASTGLTFIWMPVLFSDIGVFGRAVCILFFICLVFAGITSLIGNLELVCHTIEDFKVPRKYGAIITALLVYGIGLMSALSVDILSNQDFVWGFALLINGLFLQTMAIMYGASRFRATCYNLFSLDDWKLPKLWEIIIKYIAPIEAIVLITWWAIDLIIDEEDDGIEWYTINEESFLNTITQWISLLVVVVTINVVAVYCRKNKGREYFERQPLLAGSLEEQLHEKQNDIKSCDSGYQDNNI